MEEYWNENMSLEEVTDRNSGIVYTLANKYERSLYKDPASDISDLIQEGYIGLIKAYNTFDISKGVKFITYANRCIENEIRMYLRKRNKQFNKSINETISRNIKGDQVEGEYVDIIDSGVYLEEDIMYNETQKNLKENLMPMIYKLINECYTNDTGKLINSEKWIEKLTAIVNGYYWEIIINDKDKVKHTDVFRNEYINGLMNNSRTLYNRYIYIAQGFVWEALAHIGEYGLYMRYKNNLHVVKNCSVSLKSELKRLYRNVGKAKIHYDILKLK